MELLIIELILSYVWPFSSAAYCKGKINPIFQSNIMNIFFQKYFSPRRTLDDTLRREKDNFILIR